jgi:hypothetical protein
MMDFNQKCSVLIGQSRDRVELERIIVEYNDLMPESDTVTIEENHGFMILTGNALNMFQIGIRYGERMERRYLKELSPALREIVL